MHQILVHPLNENEKTKAKWEGVGYAAQKKQGKLFAINDYKYVENPHVCGQILKGR